MTHGIQQQIVQTRAVRTNRDSIAIIAHVCIILASIGLATETIRQALAKAAAPAPAPEVGEVEEHAYTNAVSAHLTFTNLNAFPAETCVRGIVKPKGKLAPIVQSAPVCTGEMKPRTTVVLEAPYPVGEVEELCASEADRFGNTHVDWSKCTFTTSLVGRK